MIGLRAKVTGGAIGATVAVLACAAFAQSTPPIPLRPSPDGVRSAVGVQVESLAAPDPNSVGILDERHGGFGVDMWSGSSRALIQSLLPALPAATPSRTMRAMMRRLLLSAAAVPEGPSPAGDSLLTQRVDRLWAMGEVDAMLALIDAAPRGAETSTLLRYRVDGLLLKGDVQGACRDVDAAQAAGDTDGYLSKVESFCHAVGGRTADAQLTIDWLHDRGVVDPVFFDGIDVLLGRHVPDAHHLPQPRPLHLAVLRAAKRPLPSDAADGSEPAVLRAIALSDNAPTEVRLVAAEKAEHLGVLDSGHVRALYAATTFTDTEAEIPLSDAAQDWGARSRALLFRAAQLQKSAKARAEVINRAFALARQHGHFDAAARLYAPLILSIKPSADLGHFAGHAVRALLAAGAKDAVGPWLKLAQKAGEDSGPVWPLLRLVQADEDRPIRAGLLRKWLAQRAPLPPERASRQAAVLFGMLDALGDKVATEDWLPLMGGPVSQTVTMPQPALWHAQRIAAEDLRLGETVLLSLVSLGVAGPGAAEPTNLYRIVASLRLVGLDDEARALALEAALANGI